MKKTFSILVMALYFRDLFSADAIIDAYGIDDATASKIISHCGKSIQEFIKTDAQMSSSSDKHKDIPLRYMKSHDQIIQQIKKYGDFNFVDISIIYYPDKNKKYTTIDIVPTSKISRIPESPKRVINKELTLDANAKRVFKLWAEYNENNIKLINNGMFHSKKRTCPVTHCTWGFDKNEIIKFLPKFRDFANTDQKQLMDIIKFSANDEERGAAIFILAHSDNYKATASFLANYIDDKSDLIRNNTLRVIGGISSTHKIEHLPLKKILEALNYPLVTDRNKAAYVLHNIAHGDPSTHQHIIMKAGNILISLLKLQQPNNHDFAYLILKEISHKNYSEQDYQSWQNWLDLQNKKLKMTSNTSEL